MKKILYLLLLFLFLTACDQKPNSEIGNGTFIVISNHGGFNIVRDTNTGCLYYHRQMNYQAALSPYYDEKGEVAGCGDKELDKEKYK